MGSQACEHEAACKISVWCMSRLPFEHRFIHAAAGKNRQIAYNVRGTRSPEEYAIPFEDHFLTTKDKVNIHAWLLKYVLCFFLFRLPHPIFDLVHHRSRMAIAAPVVDLCGGFELQFSSIVDHLPRF